MTQSKRYVTGDKHPIHNCLAFVEYEKDGTAVWTSVYNDPDAPFRLAKLNAENELSREREL